MKHNPNRKKSSQVTRFLYLIIILMITLIIGGCLLIYDSYTKGKAENNNSNEVVTDNEQSFSIHKLEDEKETTSEIKIIEETRTPVAEATAAPKSTPSPKPKKTAAPHKHIKIAIDAGHQAQGDSGTEPDGPGSDIYIRIHADGVDNSSVSGASALYPSPSNPYVANLSKSSERLSKCILNEYCKETGIDNRGLSIRDDLTGTNWSEIPVTLIELGFLSNPEEDTQMQISSFQNKMAEGIANGIDLYYYKFDDMCMYNYNLLK